MNIWRYIIKLLIHGFLSLLELNNGSKFVIIGNIITFICVPILYSIYCYNNSVNVAERINDILTTISIFLAIALGVIFIVPDKLTNRIKQITTENESDVLYIKKFKDFCKLFIKRLTFLLLISVFIIIISICVPGLPTYIQKYISSSIMGLFILSILSILKLIVDIYKFLIENIK